MKLKRAELGDTFMWQGEQTSVDGTSDGRVVYFTTRKKMECKNCGHVHFELIQNTQVESSPNFQDNARPIQTLRYVKEGHQEEPTKASDLQRFFDIEKKFS